MKRIPLYFNYIGSYPEILDRAIKSIPERFEVKVNWNENPVPFTKCLNHILETETSQIWFFMHYDAEILDPSIFDKMLDVYDDGLDHEGRPIAAVSSCSILDLLILIDSERVKFVGGWDEGLKNSYMEVDLRKRIYDAGFGNPIIYEGSECPIEMSHNDYSLLRDPEKEGNISHIYKKSLEEDFTYFYTKWEGVFERPSSLEDFLKSNPHQKRK